MTARPTFRPDQLTLLRIVGGFSLRGLSRESGVSFSQLAALERGENEPTPATLRKIAEALDVDVTRLLNDAEVSA